MKGNNIANVYLRAFELEDEEFLISLRKNKDLFKYTCGTTYFISSEHTKKMLQENIIGSQTQIYLIICLVGNNTPLGYLSLVDIDHTNKKACWGGVVMDPSHSGKGYATEAALLMLKFAFEELNMNKVYGKWMEEHASSLRIAEKIGFIMEGKLRASVYKNNKYNNVCVYSMLKDEYLALAYTNRISGTINGK